MTADLQSMETIKALRDYAARLAVDVDPRHLVHFEALDRHLAARHGQKSTLDRAREVAAMA